MAFVTLRWVPKRWPIPRRVIIIFLLRLCLGGLFIYASLAKIQDATRFKEIIVNYEVLPYWLINMTAVILPWIEFWTGIFILAGIFVRACIIMQSGLLVLFILVTGLNIARGLEFYCGCFAEDSILTSTSHWHIIFNTFWLLMVITLYLLERRRFSHRYFGTKLLA
ncbi:MAG: MauE/DoxX family redox-associated membrane protein [Thermodesulfobacteriota bacterium]